MKLSFDDPNAALPPLPEPARARFQPLRIGLVELFHYDVEEFWFRDGHLLLRGNNGTGKSKVLSLTLPFLLDASLTPVRVEPDGDRSKRMEWNLLMGGRHERRVGYSWIEFGRRREDGTPEYVTLGCGMRAVAGRSKVESWNFITEQRVGEELALVTKERTVLSRERLEELLGTRGQVFDTAHRYKRAVDERLFRLGERYDALIDTLIQLRQPQLSKKPDEQSLSEALSNALPELPRGMLEDVAEAMNQLDEYKDELAHLERVREAVSQFGVRYRRYAQIQARRVARGLRRAQTEFDKQSHELNEARATLEQATREAAEHAARVAELEQRLLGERAALNELHADPAMSDSRRLSELAAAVRRAAEECEKSRARLERERARLEHAEAERERLAQEAEIQEQQLSDVQAALRREADAAGMAAEHDACTRAFASARQPQAFADLERELGALVERRRAHILHLSKRIAACEQAERTRQSAHDTCQVHRGLCERAEEEARRAQRELELTCAAQLSAWRSYAAGLSLLSLTDVEGGLSELEAWQESLGFAQPMRERVENAQRACEAALARKESALTREREELETEDAALERELAALAAGEQLIPAALPTRDPQTRADREGAPFWRLFEFHAQVPAAARAGLEAALEAAGLLDAWVTPSAHVLHPETQDAWLEPGPGPRARSLADWLVPAPGPVPEARLAALLASIGCGDEDEDSAASTFLSPAGRFRVGTLRGAYHKAEAQYLGQAAREAERNRRIAAIQVRRAALEALRRQLSERASQLRAEREQLAAELARMPKDDPLHAAHAAYGARERQRRQVLEELAHAEAALQASELRLRAAHDELARDAGELRLPSERGALETVRTVLHAYQGELRSLGHLWLAAQRAQRTLAEQAERARTGAEQVAEWSHEVSAKNAAHSELEARHRLLQESAGAAVAELTRKLSALTSSVEQNEQALIKARSLHQHATQEVARGEQRALDGERVLHERAEQRRHTVQHLAGFAATGLLAMALPELELPGTWTVDPALTLARRVEQELAGVSAEDADWARVQNEVSRDYSALSQALSALGQRAQLDQSDYGMLVQILYHNRPERPDLLERTLSAEIEQRRGILSAREREVLENHLQAEVAAGLSRLLRDAEAQVERINAELKRRPTSTGVYFRLDWEPMAGDDDALSLGLAAARTRLLRRVAEAWSSDDRRVLGEFLSARIAAERQRDDTRPLVEQLASALDYRTWHRFRVKRWHDGAFRSLSGPASSGERALGLTVPLFAAASSHYASGGFPHAPRLVLLDEAFAGIDDEARAHCMALIREFDLDFVMTSEREWGCYATLPGVSICHILRREGVDAAFVSRWTWDGQARRAEADPTRRQALADAEPERVA